ncbi:MAG: histidinol-phosphate transaminase [Eggerthellaceae bacterium]|nr:histidinol-phosphate transaminase [Eggerthellaceae bacterium]
MSKFLSERYKDLLPYVPGEQPQDMQYVKLNTNESPFPPSPYAQRLAREAAGDLQLYPDPECKQLREIAADKFGVDIDEIVFTNGSDEALCFALMAFCGKETPVVFADVTYGFYPIAANLTKVSFETKPLKDDYSIDVEDYLSVGKTIIIANPNAPTGMLMPVQDIERIVVSNKNNVVIVDEAYIDYGGQSVLPLIKKYDNLLVCRTFSKSRSLAGGRLGFVVGNKALIADLNTVRNSFNPYNINRMTMAAGIGALIDEEYFEKNCATIIKNREFTVQELKRLGFEVLDSEANFVFAKNKKISGKDLYLSLKKKGVLVRYFDKDRLREFVRITIGAKEQMRALIEALEELL